MRLQMLELHVQYRDLSERLPRVPGQLRRIVLGTVTDRRRAVVGRKEDQRLLTQAELLERGDHAADDLVEVDEIVVVPLVRGGAGFRNLFIDSPPPLCASWTQA